MRIALISDIHANYSALEAVVENIRLQGVDQIICLGDTATIGPQPRETLNLLQSLDCTCIMGNHDAAMLEPGRAEEYQIAGSLTSTLEWGFGMLTEPDKSYLRSFRTTYEISLDEKLTLFCYHGSPRSNTELLLSTTSEEVLLEALSGAKAGILAGGHTHIQMIRQQDEQVILNPGSVGNAFIAPYISGGATPRLLPWAEYATLEAENGNWNIRLHRIRYDIHALQQAVIASGNPSRDWWLAQYR
jgi:putative phosphoesterase